MTETAGLLRPSECLCRIKINETSETDGNQELLSRPIRELGLKLEGSPVERFVDQLYRELDGKGLAKFQPAAISPTSGDARRASRSSGFRFIWRMRNWRNWKSRRTTWKMRAKS